MSIISKNNSVQFSEGSYFKNRGLMVMEWKEKCNFIFMEILLILHQTHAIHHKQIFLKLYLQRFFAGVEKILTMPIMF